jgi:hypothetical protein
MQADLFATMATAPERRIAFLMLNPSKADALRDDPTIQRCVGFATRWGGAGLLLAEAAASALQGRGDELAAAASTPALGAGSGVVELLAHALVLPVREAAATPERVARALVQRFGVEQRRSVASGLLAVAVALRSAG